MAKPRNPGTFETFKTWLVDRLQSKAEPRPLTPAEIKSYRPLAIAGYAAYQLNPKERTGNDVVDALVQVAGLRSDAGPGKPFATALNEVLDELEGVGPATEPEPAPKEESAPAQDDSDEDDAGDDEDSPDEGAAAAPRHRKRSTKRR